jgi:hypothetical protein
MVMELKMVARTKISFEREADDERRKTFHHRNYQPHTQHKR